MKGKELKAFRYFWDKNSGLSFIYTTDWVLKVKNSIDNMVVEIHNNNYLVRYILVSLDSDKFKVLVNSIQSETVLRNSEYFCLIESVIPQKKDLKTLKEIKNIIGSARFKEKVFSFL